MMCTRNSTILRLIQRPWWQETIVEEDSYHHSDSLVIYTREIRSVAPFLPVTNLFIDAHKHSEMVLEL